MYIARLKVKGQKKHYYPVFESYKVKGVSKKRYYGTLGHYPTIERAYSAALADYLRASNKLERLEYVFTICKGNTLKVAKYGSQGRNKEDIRDLVRRAGLVSFGITLPDLYIDLILAGRMRFKEAARVYMISLTDYKLIDREVH